MTLQIRPPALALLVMAAGCSTLGTKTVYKSDSRRITANALAFARLEDEDSLEADFKGTKAVFMMAMMQTLIQYGVEKSFAVDSAISFENPDPKAVADLCRAKGLDGVLLTKLSFLPPSLSQGWDTEAVVKLLDCAGALVVLASHNTRSGNSYMLPPELRTTIQDGVQGAVARVMEESGRKRASGH